MPFCRYNVPGGKIGRNFVRTLNEKLHAVCDRRWNSERFIVFQTVILQRSRHAAAPHSIQRRIEKRIDTWESGRHKILVEEKLWTY